MDTPILLTKRDAKEIRADALDKQKRDLQDVVTTIVKVAPTPAYVACYIKDRIQATPDHLGGCYGCPLFTLDFERGAGSDFPCWRWKISLKTTGPNSTPQHHGPVEVHRADFLKELDSAIRAKYLPHLPDCGIQTTEGPLWKDTIKYSLILELDKE